MVHIANGNNVGLERMHGQQVASTSLPFMAILQQDSSARAGSSSKCRSWASKAAAGTATSADNLCGGGLLLFAIRGTVSAFEWTLGKLCTRGALCDTQQSSAPAIICQWSLTAWHTAWHSPQGT
jgi:hypothetical protein